MNVFEKIEAQQKGLEHTPAWMVGEQLKDICRREPASAELIAQDLEVKEMSLTEAEKQIKAWADKQPQKGGCVCVPPDVAEEILRKFYGLPEAGAPEPKPAAPAGSGSKILDLSSFL